MILAVAHRVRGPSAFAPIAVTERGRHRIEVARIGVVSMFIGEYYCTHREDEDFEF